MEFLSKYKVWLATIAGTIGLLGVLGYNVSASMPPTRTEVSTMLEPIQDEIRGVQQTVQANSDWIALQRWKYLNTKKQQQGLSPDEAYEYCGLSRYLGFRVEGCQ